MLSQQPSLSLDHSSSSCQSSPSLLYETSSTRSIKKQPKKKINSELKRQIHIQSEQKRRAQIKDGFDELRNELPNCLNKKMYKVALLHRSNSHHPPPFSILHSLSFQSRSTHTTFKEYSDNDPCRIRTSFSRK